MRTRASIRAVKILPLYGDLTGAAQDAALAPAGPRERKIVLATSIAETSLTIAGIRVVVDSGMRRYAEFDPATGMSRLVTGKVSQAAADQRRGRAGRTSHGDCYRLWSEGTHASLAAQTPPEILHADLAPAGVGARLLGRTTPRGSTWLDPPPAAPLAQARELLRQLEAIDAAGAHHAARPNARKLGMHPRLAHMMVKSRDLGARASGLRSGGDLERTRHSARRSRRARRGLASSRRRIARRRARRCRRASAWMRAPGSGTAQLRRTGSANSRAASGIAPIRMRQREYCWRGHIRIGSARARGDGRYLLANGRGARFAEPQALAKSEFIVAAEMDGAEREARIFLGGADCSCGSRAAFRRH